MIEEHPLDTGERIFYDEGAMHSAFPAETFFGFTYWANMIPPTKPKNMLVLGYGNGTIAGLTRRVWGNDVEVLGVDLMPPECQYQGDKVIVGDAREFVLESAEKYDPFDYIVVDIYNSDKMVSFAVEEKFIEKLAEICSLRIAINIVDSQIPQFVENEQVKGYEKYFDKQMVKSVGGNHIWFYRKKGAIH